MARVPLSTVKSKFETGDRPTQQDYVDLIDTVSSQATDLGTMGNNENTIYELENQTTVDSFNATEWRLVKYLISIKKISLGDNRFYATELNILVDNDDISVSEYGVIDNDGNIGTVSVSRELDTVNVIVTPVLGVTPITVRFARIGLRA